MTFRALRACPVCGHRDVEHLHKQRFVLEEGHPLSSGYQVVSCEACGFVYADTAATQTDYDAFYAQFSKYDDPGSSTGSGESAHDKARLEATAAILSHHRPDTGARILDVGCAGGGLLAALQRRGYRNLVGIDPSAVCARITRQKTGEAYAGWLTRLPAEIGTFDLVVLSHVLEHVLDVAAGLGALALREDGEVYVEVPDAARYADYMYAPFQDFNTEHINHFSRVCLDHAMARQGFTATGGGERLLHSSPHTLTPSIYGVYVRGCAPARVGPDRMLKAAILRYIESSSALLHDIDDRIGEALRGAPELIVWGAGQLTLKLLAETQLSHAKVAAFVDSNPIHQGRRLCGAPIIPPAALSGYPEPILIGTLLHHREILEQIESLGLPNRVILLPERVPQVCGQSQA
jgi:SAM-dependent methyltransferase